MKIGKLKPSGVFNEKVIFRDVYNRLNFLSSLVQKNSIEKLLLYVFLLIFFRKKFDLEIININLGIVKINIIQSNNAYRVADADQFFLVLPFYCSLCLKAKAKKNDEFLKQVGLCSHLIYVLIRTKKTTNKQLEYSLTDIFD